MPAPQGSSNTLTQLTQRYILGRMRVRVTRARNGCFGSMCQVRQPVLVNQGFSQQILLHLGAITRYALKESLAFRACAFEAAFMQVIRKLAQ